MTKKSRRLISMLLLMSLFMTVIPLGQHTLAANVVAGRTLSSGMAGDGSEWIEIARHEGYSLILRRDPIQRSGFGETNQYSSSYARTIVNNWFNSTLSSGARLRDYTMRSNAATSLGSWTSIGNGISTPTGTAARTGNDVAFLLSFAEAALFCSTQYCSSNGASYSRIGGATDGNYRKLNVATGMQPTGHFWLRSPGDPRYSGSSGRACTVGMGGSSEWGQTYMAGAVNQYAISSNIIDIRPALWVDSGIFSQSYTLTYNANGGIGPPPPISVPENTTINLSMVIPTHPSLLTFRGWSLDQYSTTAQYQPGDPFNIGTGPKTLYAVWGQREHLLTYNANGGVGPPPPILVPENTTIYLSMVIPTHPSLLIFRGWSLDPYATAPQYQPGDPFNIGTGPKTLYAVWGPREHLLTYHPNGGAGAPPSRMVPENTTINLSLLIPTHPSLLDFLGWSLDPYATVPQYQPGDPFNIGTGPKTLYAVWGPREHLLTYHPNGGTGGPPSRMVPENTTIYLSMLQPSHPNLFTFLGWSLNQYSTTAQYQPGDPFNIGTGPKTLYAVWGSAAIIVQHVDINTGNKIIADDIYLIPSGSYGPYGPRTFSGYGPGQHLATSHPPSGIVSPSEARIIVYQYEPVRTIHGYVWPMVIDDLGFGDFFLKQHDIVVELRKTFLTAAEPELSVISVVVPNSTRPGLGEFTIENVPLGDYVLTIKRPGYLIRCMNVSVTYANPPVIELRPPGTADNNVFNLWWGDVDDNLRIEAPDIALVANHAALGISILDPGYDPAYDLDGNGRVDAADIALVVMHLGRHVYLYAGGDNVDYFS